MRALWTEDKATLDDDFTTFANCVSLPKPRRPARCRSSIGGHSEAAARRAGRLGDGFFPGKGSHEELAHLFDVMREAAEQAGRDPDAIEVTASGAGPVRTRPARRDRGAGGPRRRPGDHRAPGLRRRLGRGRLRRLGREGDQAVDLGADEPNSTQ